MQDKDTEAINNPPENRLSVEVEEKESDGFGMVL